MWLDEPTYQLLNAKAERGISMSALVREMLKAQLGMVAKSHPRFEDFRFVGSGPSEKSELDPTSERYDEALEQEFWP